MFEKMQEIIIHHISDIHFGKFEKWPVGKSRDDLLASKMSTSFSTQYILFLHRLENDERPHIIIIISGDLVSTGAENEFDEAVKFCEELTNYIQVSASSEPYTRILIVPGNHDTDWEHLDYRINRFKDKFKKFCTPYSTASHGKVSEPSLFYFPDFSMLFWLVDSTKLSGSPDPKIIELLDTLNKANSKTEFQNQSLEIARIDPGLVDAEDMKKFELNYRALKEHVKDNYCKDLDKATTCAVLHHPVSLFPRQDPTAFPLITNGGQMKTLLQKYSFDMLFHGHCHQSSIFYEIMNAGSSSGEGQGLHIVAAGSLAGFSIEESNFNKITVSRHSTDKVGVEVDLIKSRNIGFDTDESNKIASFIRFGDSTERRLTERFIDAINDTKITNKPHVLSLSHRLDVILSEKRENEGYSKSGWIDQFYDSTATSTGIYATDVLGARPLSYPIVYYYMLREFHLYSVYNSSSDSIKNKKTKSI